jgi:tetratricopeptide (TPR) repeat protein
VIGGLAGVALGTAIAWLSGFPLARTHMILIVAGIGGAWWLWRDWVHSGKLARRLPIIAVIALLVNLLAAGGISYPGLAGSLWLLVAIELNLTDRAESQTAGSVEGRSLIEQWFHSTAFRWGACIALATLLAAALWTEYLPVMACRLQLSIADAAQAAGRADQSRNALEAATTADPWSSEAAVRLAAQRFADYQTLPTPSQRRTLLDADDVARRLASHRSNVWAQGGGFAAAIHQHTGNVEDFDAAQSYFERAIELYPSNAELQANAAKFWQSAGKTDRALAAATEALRLDDLMRAGGHDDRLLAPTLRQEMEKIVH